MRENNSRLRWRDQRNTLVGKRHRRRRRRRDIARPGDYKPIQPDAGAASRGVRSRLLGALGASVMTLICMIVTFVTSLSTFGGTFALSLGLSSFGAAMALVLSARHEEQVHALAAKLESDPDPLPDDTHSPDPLPNPHTPGTDGQV